MKQRLFLLMMLFVTVGVLVLLNTLTYVQQQKEVDSELRPNRSTYNPGSTGTQAFYTLLLETGRKPVRWQDTPEGLLTARNKPSVFVVIGSLRREFTDADATSLLRWVSQGGRLIVIDRDPPEDLRTITANWKIEISSEPAVELVTVDPADQKQMTVNTDAVKPVQPSLFTTSVNAIQPSRFAGSADFDRLNSGTGISNGPEPPPPAKVRSIGKQDSNQGSPPLDVPMLQGSSADVAEPSEGGPVVYIAGNQKNILIDVPSGKGTIVYLTDPYIVSNSGINVVDNAQLALNLVSVNGGTIAFDEYHQGYGANANRLFQYFDGTPVIGIFAQCALLIGLIFVAQSRRFARPLPEKESDRLTKLEYVTAMAELQQRTRAYDLAMENIYTDFRRRVARCLGLDNLTSTRHEVALSIAERTTNQAYIIEELMAKCEAIVHGQPSNKAETLDLITRLREIEEKLGIERKPKGKPAK
jgi:hypothetical protein